MPELNNSNYRPRGILRSAHFQTIYPTLFRSVQCTPYQRERIYTDDKDFLDLDWAIHHTGRLAILCHGLEGSTDTHYMRGMTLACKTAGWDTLGFNYRGCGGPINQKSHGYTAGGTDDLATVISHALATDRYHSLALIGFSLGGNIVLKYAGERCDAYPAELTAIAVVSAPCDLNACTSQIQRTENWLYHMRFVRSLVSTMQRKKHLVTNDLGHWPKDRVSSVKQFDDIFTAPLNGYRDARDYYTQNSAYPYLQDITRPTLILNALDDPILPPSCYPREQAQQNRALFLETPQHGGHLGFMRNHPSGTYWHEQRVAAFISEVSVDRNRYVTVD